MGKKISIIIRKPIYIYLIGLLYLIFKISFVPFTFSILTALEFLIIYWLLTWVAIWVFKKFGFQQISILLAFFWISVLFHMQIVNVVQSLLTTNHVARYKFFWISELSLALVTIYFNLKFQAWNKICNKFANIWILVSLLVISVNIFFSVSNTKARLETTYNDNILAKPNFNRKQIYWFLFDEYSSSKYINSKFNFKNPLDTFLTNKGFYVFPNILSRSDFTLYSVNSIFNFDDKTLPYSFDYGLYDLKNSALPKVLKKAGYKFESYTIFDIGDNLVYQNPPFYTPTLLFKLIEGTIIQIYMQFHMLNFYMKIWLPPGEKLRKNLHPYSNEEVLSNVETNLRTGDIKPKFTFAHFIMPHSPFIKVINNKPTYHPAIDADTIGLKSGYIDNIKYTNQIVFNLLKNFPQLKNCVVIISGDHGVRFRFLNNDDGHRFWPFFAIYLPHGSDSTGLKQIKYISQVSAFVLKNNIK